MNLKLEDSFVGVSALACSAVLESVKTVLCNELKDHISNLGLNETYLSTLEIRENREGKEAVSTKIVEKGQNYRSLRVSGTVDGVSYVAELRVSFLGEYTLAIIKPNAYSKASEIMKMMFEAGLRVAVHNGEALKVEKKLTYDEAAQFYAVHKDKPFFQTNCEAMSHGPSMILVLCGEGAIKRYRTLMGATDPANAAEGTIRKAYAEDITRNAVHGSDSPENAMIEIEQFFPGSCIKTILQ